jgi:hypothetical protein
MSSDQDYDDNNPFPGERGIDPYEDLRQVVIPDQAAVSILIKDDEIELAQAVPTSEQGSCEFDHYIIRIQPQNIDALIRALRGAKQRYALFPSPLDKVTDAELSRPLTDEEMPL